MSDDFDLPNFAPTDPLMFQAWADCLHWAIGQPDIVRWFEEETGLNWPPPFPPIDTAIAEAVGAASAYMKTFVPWFNANVWSDMGGEHE
jgi:hypothetical protein